MNTKVTGEYLLPGKFPKKTEDEHFERYIFASNFVKGKKVLDIACGVGYGCKMFSKSGANYIIGIDILNDNIKHAKDKYSASNIIFIQGNLYDIDYEEEFDIITSFETIEHIEDDSLALNKFYTALTKDGILIISTPNRKITSPTAQSIKDRPLNEYHIREYTLSDFKKLVNNNGFRVKNVFGQRNRLYLPYSYFNRVINKFLKPDENSNAKLKKCIISVARYYTFVLEKIV